MVIHIWEGRSTYGLVLNLGKQSLTQNCSTLPLQEARILRQVQGDLKPLGDLGAKTDLDALKKVGSRPCFMHIK